MKYKILLAILLFFTSYISATVQPTIAQAKDYASKVSWAFEENKGQVIGADSSKVKYFYKAGGLTMFLLNEGIAYQFEKHHYPEGYPQAISKKNSLDHFQSLDSLTKLIRRETYRMDIELIGANQNCEIITEGKSPDYIQYYNHKALDVHAYQKITYKNIYPNIDWVVYLNANGQTNSLSSGEGRGEVKYDFIVHPGGNSADIKLKSKWAENIKINADGSIVFKTNMGSITDNAPISFQENISIQTQFKLNDCLISFQISDYDKSKTLTIDPNIVWSTYYGGSDYEIGNSCKVDNSGNIYLAGGTSSSTNIFSGGHQNSLLGTFDAFLVKFNTSGTRLWSTYYGGSGSSSGWLSFCTTDNIGNVFLSGYSGSTNNIASSGHQNTYGGGTSDAYLVKFNSSGTRLWGTYYGGTFQDVSYSCATDKFNNIYLTGSTLSTSNISSGGHQNTYGGGLYGDAFLVKFNSSGTRLWGTYYGGNNCGDIGNSCCTDTFGNIYMTGSTFCPSNIASGGHQNTFGGPMYSGWRDAFLVKFNGSGTRLWGTYYGGYHEDGGTSCATDFSGNVYLAGTTLSDTAIAFGGHQNFRDSLYDIFLVKFNSGGTRQWATYYGGKSSEEYSAYCIIDNFGDVFLSGTTESKNNIAINGWKDTLTGSDDAFLVKFDSLGLRKWGSYFGGNGSESDFYSQCTKDNFGNIYLAGTTNSNSNISLNGFQNSFGGNQDAFLVKISDIPSITIFKDKSDTICLGTTVFFYDTIRNGGTSPKFKWYKNNVLIDTNISFSTSILNHGDSIKCLLKSNASGLFVDSAWSNTLRIYFYPISSKNIYDTICSNQSILFNNLPRTNPGIYFDTLISSKGCDSVLTLHLAIKPTSSGIRYDSICPGQSILFNSQNVSVAGVYKDTLVNSQGCDSFLDMHLFVKSSTTGVRFDTICYNHLIHFNGKNIATAGSYFDTLVNSQGCDSFLTMNLSVRPLSNGAINQSICAGYTYFFNGIGRSVAGTYQDTLMNSHGCDSFLTLNLTIKSSDTLHIRDTICEPQSYWFNNQTFYSSGVYRDTFTSSQGCDSFVFLHLYVKDTSRYVFSHITPCDPNASFMFNGLARTQSGTYSAKYLNALGCDSTAVLNLTIRKPSTPSQFEVRLCLGDSFYFGGIQRKDSGDYPLLLTNSLGCDSLITLRLRPLKKPLPESNTIQACSPFSFLGKTYTSSTIVLDTIKSINGNCDSVFRTNIIQLKPPATIAPENNHIICDSIRLNNRLYTTSFSFIDTFRTVGTVCDSVYRKTNYTIRSTPQIGLKERDTFMRGAQVTLKPFSVTNYLWSTGETTKNLSFKLTEDRQLYLIAWNEEPCRDTAYISLVAEDLAIVGMPTGFSPTGEHTENRTLRPNINGRLEYFHMMVFNRWGEKVYETFDTQPLGWNGIFKGETAPAGLYGYVLEYRTLGVNYTKSGEVMLVR